MAAEFPSSVELLRQLVEIPGHYDDLRPEVSARMGVYQRMEIIQDLVRRWGLGEAQIHPYSAPALNSNERVELSTLTIDVGEGDELVVLEGHLDTVPPPKEYQFAEIHPYHLRKRRDGDGDIWEGLGTYDMLGGDVAIIRALHGMQVDHRRRIRAIFVADEEWDSRGMYDAYHQGLLNGASCFITTEIPVGRTLNDAPELIIGRNGRATFEAVIKALAPQRHGGDDRIYDETEWSQHLTNRFAQALIHIEQIAVPPNPNHPEGFMRPSRCTVRQVEWDNAGDALSTNEEGTITFDAKWSDSAMGVKCVELFVLRELEEVLGSGVYVQPKQRRTEYIPPWLEELQHPFVQNMLAKLRCYTATAQLGAGGAVAEEAIMAHKIRRPVVTVSPRGEKEHVRGEAVDVEYIDRVMTPVLRDAAKDPEPLAP